MTSIRTIIFALCEKIPGLSAKYLESLQYFDFIEYKILLEQKMKAEKEEAEKHSADMNKANNYKLPKMTMPKMSLPKIK